MRCSCGFAELDDEEITDHLELVFAPADGRGKDGRVHDEQDRLTCLCGLTASTPGELDAHFMEVLRQMTPLAGTARGTRPALPPDPAQAGATG